jgi:putative FmdB family regulatory protein
LPIYEYECTRCSCQFELRKSFGENSGASCPKCQGEGRRIFSPVPIIFKGSGFYVTDSRAKNSNIESDNGSKESKEEKGGNQEETKKESVEGTS